MNVIITGATGMIGKGVLIECLEHSDVEKVLVINRTSLNIKHDKLEEVIHDDFTKFENIKKSFNGYDACFYCLGVSSVGLNEQQYTNITYDMTESFAHACLDSNPNMVFNYVSGAGTDSTEEGRSMWARVKGKTENMLFNIGFKDVYAFRPGGILPKKGVKSKSWYQFIISICKPIYPLLEKMNGITTSEKLGLAMINSVLYPQNKKKLENSDINQKSLREII